MNNRRLWVLGGSIWFVVAFYVVFRMTFPSSVLIERARFELDQATSGAMGVEIRAVGPWWTGLKARDVVLLDEEGQTLLKADVARFRVSPFSLLSEPRVHAAVQFGKGALEADAVLARTDRGISPTQIRLEADRFPIGAIPPIRPIGSGDRFVPQGTYQIRGTGTLDLAVDLRAASGLSKADGTLRISGRTMNIEDITGLGELLGGFSVLPLAIDELDLRIEITQGKGRVVLGLIKSSLLTAELQGDITLDDVITRSRLRLQGIVDLGAAMQPFAGLLSSAKWADGRYHYAITGTLGRPSAAPERERASRRPSTPTSSPPPPGDDLEPARGPAPETLEAAREARERRMEALRERRSGREAARAVPGAATREPDEKPLPVDEDLDDEEVPEGGGDEEMLDEEMEDPGPDEEF